MGTVVLRGGYFIIHHDNLLLVVWNKDLMYCTMAFGDELCQMLEIMQLLQTLQLPS
jgi:hypothetical protein